MHKSIIRIFPTFCNTTNVLRNPQKILGNALHSGGCTNRSITEKLEGLPHHSYAFNTSGVLLSQTGASADIFTFDMFGLDTVLLSQYTMYNSRFTLHVFPCLQLRAMYGEPPVLLPGTLWGLLLPDFYVLGTKWWQHLWQWQSRGLSYSIGTRVILFKPNLKKQALKNCVLSLLFIVLWKCFNKVTLLNMTRIKQLTFLFYKCSYLHGV